jgi:hypothetical protein
LKNENLLNAFFVCTETNCWKDLAFTSQDFFDLESLWRHNYISNSSLSFLAGVFMEANLTSLGDQSAPFYFLQSQILVNLKDLKVDRLAFLDFLNRVYSVVEARFVTVDEYHDIVCSLPKKWFEKIETLEADPDNILSNLVLFLEILISNQTKDLDQKIHILVDYICDLLTQQTNDEILRDPLVKHSQAFSDSSLTNIEVYVLERLELKWKEAGLNIGLPLLLNVFSTASKSLKHFGKLYHGIIESIKKSNYPLFYLDHSCSKKISPEQLALISETCINRYLSIASVKEWSLIYQSLRLPEIEESTFIRHCLSHCLVYTLFAHASSRLLGYEGNLELRIMIGEQIGIWVESLHREALQSDSER